MRAVEAAVGLGRELGLRVGEPVVLGNLFSVMVHLRPAPVVVRVATRLPKLRSPIGEWLGREIAVAGFLEERGAPVAGPSREVAPGPYVYQGFSMSCWQYHVPDPERAPTAADCSAMLVDLHAVLREYPGELPMFCADDIANALGLLDGASLGDEDVQLLRDAARGLGPFMESPGEVQALHGDAHPGNLLATRKGLVWIDFEDVCRGPVEWDLATMMDADAVALYHRPDPERLAKCTRLRALQVALAMAAFADEFRQVEGWFPTIQSMLEML